MLWSLLHSLLQASTAFCSWCCRPRGHDVRSSPSPISFALWACHTFSWESIQSVLLSVSQGDWLASFDLREAYIPVTVHLLLVPFFASCYVTRSTSSKLCALASPRLRRSSPGSWLLFQLYSILWVSVCVDTSTPGWSSLPLRSLSSRFFYLSSDFVQFLGLSSIPGIPTSYLPR